MNEDVAQELRDRAHDMATGVMMSEVREQVEWRGADEIERLLEIINRAGALALQKASHEMIRETLSEAKR